MTPAEPVRSEQPDSRFEVYDLRMRLTHLALVIAAGVLLIVLAVFSSGKAIAYVIGVAALAAASVMAVAALLPSRPLRRLVLGGAAIAAATSAAVAVAVPRYVLSADRGDHLVTFETRGKVADAVAVGDVVVIRVQDESGGVDIVVADAVSGRELGRHPTSDSARMYPGRGAVAAVEADGDSITAIAVDGSESWAIDARGEFGEVSPVAVHDDGTVVTVQLRDEQGRRELVAIGPEGDERWRRRIPFDTALGVTPRANVVLADRIVLVRGNPVQDGERLVSIVDRETGEIEELDRALDAEAGAGFIALLNAADGACEVVFVIADGVNGARHELACPDEWSLDAIERHVEIVRPDGSTTWVDAASGAAETFLQSDDPPIVSNLGFLDEDEAALVRPIGGDPFVLDGEGWARAISDTLDTIRIGRALDSHNPVRPGNPLEIVLIDVASAERCARATFDGDPERVVAHQTIGLAGCRAIVEIDGELTLVGREP